MLNLGANSAIDISDGLLDDLNKLCKSSNVGAEIHSNDLPIDSYLKIAFRDDYLDYALNGGEDYELLFTVAMEDFPKIKGNPNLSVIGHITKESEGVHLITRANTKIPIIAKGWNSFKDSE